VYFFGRVSAIYQIPAAMYCSCIFCTSEPCDTLPVPVLIVHPNRLLSFWVWMTSLHPMKLYITVKDNHNGVYPKPLKSLEEAIRYASKLFNIEVSASDIPKARIVVKSTSASSGFECVTNLDQSFRGPRAIMPPNIGESCLCKSGSFQTSSSFTLMPRRSTKAPAKAQTKRAPDSSSNRPSKKTCQEGMIAKFMSPSNVSNANTSHSPVQDVETSAFPDVEMNDASSPSKEEGIPYNLLQLGGSQGQINEILAARPTWDEETVEELLRWGARPKLHRVHNVYEGGQFTRVRCTFVHPTGKLVENVWLPLSILKAEYAREISHL
jgi:hypothetical protein